MRLADPGRLAARQYYRARLRFAQYPLRVNRSGLPSTPKSPRTHEGHSTDMDMSLEERNNRTRSRAAIRLWHDVSRDGTLCATFQTARYQIDLFVALRLLHHDTSVHHPARASQHGSPRHCTEAYQCGPIRVGYGERAKSA